MLRWETIRFYLLSAFGLTSLEATTLIDALTDINEIFITIFQFAIAGLTVWKLTSDLIKKHKRDKRQAYLDEKVKQLVEQEKNKENEI
ncbi:MAG: hypothetical protein GF350_04790 [Chitinivibrionales bacterium]|nr:hypothetical protein [Chitinivibrionales bacterium]